MAEGGTQQEQAQQDEHDREEARDEMRRVEENPPGNLEDWPGGKAKYMTMGGPEGDEGYEDGPTSKLGPSDLRHHEDGSVSVAGEQVDDPEQYKGDPIPGGPTDPEAPQDPAMPGNERGEKSQRAEEAADDPEVDRQGYGDRSN
jgi:hypothetical protein